YLQFLSDAIETKTGVLISVSTIKRLLQGQFARLPQIATLDALARFLDHASRQAFKLSQLIEEVAPPGRVKISISVRMLATIGLLVLATLGLFAVRSVRRPQLAHTDKSALSAIKTTSNAI